MYPVDQPEQPIPPSQICLRRPTAEDGLAVHQLVKRSPPLDPNSVYCNLLQTSHFAGTSVCAERDGVVCGFIAGYRLPEQPDTLFIWQVAVDESVRGQGVALSMLIHLLQRPGLEITALQTTITADNAASWRLFNALAHRFDAPTQQSLLFDRDRHFDGRHDSEYLLTVGPLLIPH